MLRFGALLVAILGSLPVDVPAQSAVDCNLDLTNAFGPFDYRTATHDQKMIVETNHFNRGVESLTRGQSSTIGGDLNYVLRVFPNHPRALTAMARLARKEGARVPTGGLYSPECWFERAIQFQPDDPAVRLVYGVELLRDGRRDRAVEQLKLAEASLGDDANVAYNLGLAYFDLRDYPNSLAYAHKAYRLGFPLPGLRNKLERAGHWSD